MLPIHAGDEEEVNGSFLPYRSSATPKQNYRIAGAGFCRIDVIPHHLGSEGLQSLCLRKGTAELALEEWLETAKDGRAEIDAKWFCDWITGWVKAQTGESSSES